MEYVTEQEDITEQEAEGESGGVDARKQAESKVQVARSAAGKTYAVIGAATIKPRAGGWIRIL